ncbi:MAG: PAS domain-containing protein [Leptospiraceae bacterium]|nr:PAS domain-containing protein [Leptospiraceae bacterium]MCP5512780.1 PAS domain-containing protein [Leptospiraceae bacterium]
MEIFYYSGWILFLLLLIKNLFDRNKTKDSSSKVSKSKDERKIFNMVLDMLPLNVFIKDSEGKFLFINKKSEETLNVNRFDILGKTDFDIFPEDVAYYLRKVDREVINTKTANTHEEKLIINGEEKYLYVHKAPLTTESLSDTMLLGFSMDITEKKTILKELEEKNSLIEKVIDTSPNLIFLKDYDGNFLLVNQAVADIFSKPKDEITNKNNAEVHQNSEELKHYSTVDREVADLAKTISVEETFTLPSGEVLYYYTTKTPFYSGKNKPDILAISTDITKLKMIEMELKDAIKTSENASRIKSEFLATISHEIRTPLNGIIGMSSLLQQTDLTPEQKDILKNLNISSQNLLVIINDILDFSSFEKNEISLDLKKFNLKHCFDDCMNSYRERIASKNLKLNLNLNIQNEEILSDSTRLRQVVNHLIGNAIKFTDKGYISIECFEKPINEHSSKFTIDILDSGIGIKTNLMDHLFQPFYQVDSSNSRSYSGTGLGLAISMKIAKSLGGDIFCESKFGKGSKFSFTFVAEIEKQTNNDIQASNTSNKSRPVFPDDFPLKILLAEDNIINQKIVFQLLKKIGYTIDIVSNGLEVLEITHKNKYDLIFMDVQMPQMDGLVATRRLLERKDISSLHHCPHCQCYGRR